MKKWPSWEKFRCTKGYAGNYQNNSCTFWYVSCVLCRFWELESFAPTDVDSGEAWYFRVWPSQPILLLPNWCPLYYVNCFGTGRASQNNVTAMLHYLGFCSSILSFFFFGLFCGIYSLFSRLWQGQCPCFSILQLIMWLITHFHPMLLLPLLSLWLFHAPVESWIVKPSADYKKFGSYKNLELILLQFPFLVLQLFFFLFFYFILEAQQIWWCDCVTIWNNSRLKISIKWDQYYLIC